MKFLHLQQTCKQGLADLSDGPKGFYTGNRNDNSTPYQRARLQGVSVEEAEYLHQDWLEVALLEQAAESDANEV